MGNAVSILSGIGMAVGPPCIYLGQVIAIQRKKDSAGLSPDVCAVLLVANVMRCVFWLGKRFEFPLLMQSLCLIVAMLGLQYLLIKYKRPPPPGSAPKARRPFNFWQWDTFGAHVEFLAGLIVVLCAAYLVLGSFGWFIDALGFVALGIESQLPTPQVISNFRRKSTAGLQLTTIAGWLGGDIYKTVYFYLRDSPSQFIICGLITVSLDLVIVGQRLYYGTAEPSSGADDDEAEADGAGVVFDTDHADDDDVERGGRRAGGARGNGRAEEERALTADADER